MAPRQSAFFLARWVLTEARDGPATFGLKWRPNTAAGSCRASPSHGT